MGLFFEKVVFVLVLALVNGDEHNHIVSESMDGVVRSTSLSILFLIEFRTCFCRPEWLSSFCN